MRDNGIPLIAIFSRKMKTLFRIALVGLLIGHVAAKPVLAKEQVVRIGGVVLSSLHYRQYKEFFSCDDPQYIDKEKEWSFSFTGNGFPVTCGSPLYFFEIRDADGAYRIGSISRKGFSPKTADKFHLDPSVRSRIQEICKEKHPA